MLILSFGKTRDGSLLHYQDTVPPHPLLLPKLIVFLVNYVVGLTI